MKRKIKFLGALAILAALINTICLTSRVSAFTSVDRKAIGYAIDQCYSARAGTGNYIVARSIQLDELNDVSNVIMPTSSYMLHLPISPETLSLSQNNYSCYALFQGTKLIPTWDGGVNGLLSAAGVDKNLTTLEKKKALLDALGYKINDSNSNGWCFNLNLSRKQVNGDNIPKLQETQQICSMSGEVSGQGIEINGSAGGEALQPVVFSLAGDNLIMKLLNEQNIGNGYTEYTFDLNKYNNVQQIQTYGSAGQALAAELNNAFVNHFSNGVTTVAQAAGSPRYTYTYWKGDESSLVFEESSNSNSAQYDLEGARTSAIKTANNLLGADFSGIADMAFTADEMYQLYMKYLTDFYGIDGGEGIQCNVDSATVNNLKNTGWQEIPYVLNGNLQTCYAKATRHTGQNDEDKVYGLNNQNLFTGERLSWTDLTTKLKNNASSMTAAGIADDGENGINFNDDKDNDKDNESIRATCMNTAGNTLGWVLCPILDMLSSATSSLYDWMVAPNLRIEPMLFNQSSASGTKQAWDIFQTVANMAIVVLFLFVIFSQLTGIGIDNYGIKRILPKIILVAILMNLSYYICLIFIDISNIAGNGIQAIFNSLPANIENSNFSAIDGMGSTIVSVALVGGIATIAGFAGVFSVATLFALLPTVVSVVVSIFFLFLILSVRQAAVVVFVVISPLAFVCYMLPNTKKWFDRWVKIMQAILLVFPICGLMVAGGNYVSKLLLASGFGDGGIVNAITAMLAGIVPIFFIPSVLRGSMNGLAGIGGKISSFGRSLGARGSNAVRNNKAYQERMQYEKNKVDVGRARRIQRALSRKENLNERQKNKLRMAQEAVAADENRKLRDRFGSTQESFDSRIKNQEAAFSNEREKMFTETFGRMTDRNDIVKELEQALDGEDSERASAALASLIERGGTKEALEALEYRKVRDANGNVSNVRRNWSDMNGDVRNRLLQKMGSTNVDAMKSFAKYRNTGGNASFGDWYSGIGDARDSESVKDRTYAQHLLDNGFKAMGGYSKDEIEYVERHLSDIQNTMAAQGKAGELAGMITNAALYSKDAKAQTVAERMIESGQIGIRDMGLTADMIGSMRGDTAAAMRKGIEAQIRSSNAARGITMTDQQIEDQARTILRTTLAPQIKAIESDRRILNRTADGTRAELGIGQVDINPQSGAKNNAAQNDGSGNLVPDQTMYSRGNSGRSSETAAPTGTVIYDAATGQTVQPYKGPTQPTQPQRSSSQTAPTGTVIYDAATGQTTPPYRNPNNTNNRPNREPSQSGDINIPRGEDNDDDINYVG